jgi:hypothetical protein
LKSSSSPVNRQVGEEQIALDRSANSLVGLLFGVQAHRRSLGFARDDKERATVP